MYADFCLCTLAHANKCTAITAYQQDPDKLNEQGKPACTKGMNKVTYSHVTETGCLQDEEPLEGEDMKDNQDCGNTTATTTHIRWGVLIHPLESAPTPRANW